jgi:hypothetical protein
MEAIRVRVDAKWRFTLSSKYDYCFLLDVIFVIIAIIAIFFSLRIFGPEPEPVAALGLVFFTNNCYLNSPAYAVK